MNGNTGTLACGGVTVGINLTGANLDTNHDYVLFNLTGTTPAISGSFNPAPFWLGTTPPGSGTFSIAKSNNTIVLHYTAAIAPSIISAFATPNPAIRGQAVSVSATITPGSGTINPSNGVTVSGSAIVGSSAFLVLSGGNVYTNRVIITNTAASGIQTLTVSVTDSTPFTRTASISLIINPMTDIWNGAAAVNNNNWNNATNWANQLFPVAGDSLVFDGPTNLLPNMEGAYNIAALTFSSSAGNFNLVSTNAGASLTLTGGVTNNSTNVQNLNLPLVLNVPVTFLPLTGSLAVGGSVSDAGGGLTINGGNTLALAGTNTYTGSTTISNGTFAIGGTGQLGSGNYAANITNCGTFTYNSSAAQTLSGIISGTGALNQNGSSILTLSSANTYTGNTTINAGTLALGGSGSIANSANILLGSGATLDVSAIGGFTIGAAQTLAGRGGVNGDLTINGFLSPGDSTTGTLTFSNSLTLTDGSTNLFKINPSPLTNDTVVVGGALTNGGTLLVTNIGASSLAAGISFQLFNAGNYNGNFASAILPALPVGLAWNTGNLNTSGTISIVLTTTPVFGPVSVSGGGLVFSGSGGVGGANYILLEATNLVTPPANWTPILTNQFDNSGNFIFTNPIDPNAPQSFYRIELP
jgi:autotransporter-associated beta strand protein